MRKAMTVKEKMAAGDAKITRRRAKAFKTQGTPENIEQSLIDLKAISLELDAAFAQLEFTSTPQSVKRIRVER